MRRSRHPRALVAAAVALVTVGLVAALGVSGSRSVAAQPAPGGSTTTDGSVTGGSATTVELYVFHLRTCPHCQAALAFLDELQREVPELVVHAYEVSDDAEAQRRFVEMTAARGGDASAVPTIVLGDRMWVGFDASTAAQIRATVEALVAHEPSEPAVEESEHLVDVPLVGEVDVGSTSMLVSTAVIALVDGVNPCSLWVLSILLALVLHSRSRRRVVLVGTTFLLVTTALYGLYVVGAYSLLSYASYLPWIQRIVAAVVAVFAVVNIRDWFRVGEPAVLAIPESAKPGIYRRGRALVASDRSVLAVVAGTAVLAAGVSLVETPCSAALPILWTDLLAAHDVGFAAAATLFALYMAIFLVDELVLFAAVVVTMRATRLQERHGRLLRLVTGSVMLGLAGAMVVDPGLLGEVGGTLAVLAATAATMALLGAAGWLVERRSAGAAARGGRAAQRPA